MARTLNRSSLIRLLACAACLAGVLAPSVASAQDNEDGFNKRGDDAIAADKQAKDEAASGDRMPGERDPKAAPEPSGASTNDPREDPLKTYYFVGARIRDVVVPKFILNAFADGAATVNVFTFGPEFTSRKNKVEYDIGLSYADYSMKPFLFKGKNDNSDAWEMVSSDMKVVYATIDLLYQVWGDPSGRFAFMIGGGLGLGGVFGNLYRTQVYSAANPIDPSDVGQWDLCRSAETNPMTYMHINPETGNTFCDQSNDHFAAADGTYHSEPSWANGGSKPFIIPWLSIPQISFRVKPVKQFQARADLGFAATGFFWGLSLAYGI